MKIFCFPYAGGSSNIYANWQANLGNNVKVIPFELSGRGKRASEKRCDTIDDVIEDFFNSFSTDFFSEPYMLFGHSMGGYIVYKLLEEIRKKEFPMPEQVFVSGAKPPHIKDKSRKDHLLPYDEFLDLIKSYGKTPAEFFESKELLEYFLPILRSDFRIASFSIDDESSIVPFDIDFTIFLGDNEGDYTFEEAKEWGIYTKRDIRIHTIKGSHFFIDENPQELLEKIFEKIPC